MGPERKTRSRAGLSGPNSYPTLCEPCPSSLLPLCLCSALPAARTTLPTFLHVACILQSLAQVSLPKTFWEQQALTFNKILTGYYVQVTEFHSTSYILITFKLSALFP